MWILFPGYTSNIIMESVTAPYDIQSVSIHSVQASSRQFTLKCVQSEQCIAIQLRKGGDGLGVSVMCRSKVRWDNIFKMVSNFLNSFLTSSADQCFFLLSFVDDDLHVQLFEIISPTSIRPVGYDYWTPTLPVGGGGVKLLNHFVTKFIILIFLLMIYTYKLFKAFPPYFTGSSLAFVNKAQWLIAY